MPDLSKISGVFSGGIRTVEGRVLRGVLTEPNQPVGSYVGDFLPRHIFTVEPYDDIPETKVVTDLNGIHYICMPWGGTTFGAALIARAFLLFEVASYVSWTRESTTVEPISGLGSPGPVISLDVIPIARDASRLVQGSLQVTSQGYSIITTAAVQAGDLLGTERAQRARVNQGITFVEVL